MANRLEDLVTFQIAMEIGEDIWKLISVWNYFDRETLGKQIVRSADSIALNIAEGYGRFHYKETKNFCFIARGSNLETKAALTKARNRNLKSEDDFRSIYNKLERIHKLLNGYIKSIGPPHKINMLNSLIP